MSLTIEKTGRKTRKENGIDRRAKFTGQRAEALEVLSKYAHKDFSTCTNDLLLAGFAQGNKIVLYVELPNDEEGRVTWSCSLETGEENLLAFSEAATEAMEKIVEEDQSTENSESEAESKEEGSDFDEEQLELSEDDLTEL